MMMRTAVLIALVACTQAGIHLGMHRRDGHEHGGDHGPLDEAMGEAMKEVSADCKAQVEELKVFEQPAVDTEMGKLETQVSQAMGGMMSGMMSGKDGAMGGLKETMGRRLLQKMGRDGGSGSGKDMKDMVGGLMDGMGDMMGSGKPMMDAAMMSGLMTELQPKLDAIDTSAAEGAMKASLENMKSQLVKCTPEGTHHSSLTCIPVSRIAPPTPSSPVCQIILERLLFCAQILPTSTKGLGRG